MCPIPNNALWDRDEAAERVSSPNPFFLTLLQEERSFDTHSMNARLVQVSCRGEDRWRLVGDL